MADTVVADANNLDIPDEVMEHPIIQSLNEATNDLVTWSNVCTYLLVVIVSYYQVYPP